MSKRHRKIRDMMSFSDNDDLNIHDQTMYQAPKGKKPKGKHRRANVKKAYYDD